MEKLAINCTILLLSQVRDGNVPASWHESDGICNNLERDLVNAIEAVYEEEIHYMDMCDTIDIVQNWLKDCFKTWPHFSGRTVYPVPGTDYECCIDQYVLGSLWTGQQLGLRIDLAHHLLNNIETLYEEFYNEVRRNGTREYNLKWLCR